MSARLLPARDYAALKTAFARLLDALGGGSAASRLGVRVRQQQLSNYARLAEEQAECFAPLDVVADLEAELVSLGGRPLVTEFLAELAGYRLARAEKPAQARPWVAELGLLAKEVGDFSARIGEAEADGRIDPAENEGCLQEAREARQKLDELIARLQAGPGAPPAVPRIRP